MDEMELWARGLMTAGLGPPLEWHPATAAEHQWFYNAFWRVVEGLMPDNEDDEPYWMTEDATTRLTNN